MLVTDDATCTIEPTMEHGYALAYASTREVAEAAGAVMFECVIPRRIGGTARMIGECIFEGERGSGKRITRF